MYINHTTWRKRATQKKFLILNIRARFRAVRSLRSKISEYFEKYGMKETLEAFNKECKQKASQKADSEKKNGRKRRKNDDVIDEVLDITDGTYSLIHFSFSYTHLQSSNHSGHHTITERKDTTSDTSLL